MCGPSVALTPCNTGNDAGRLGPRRLPVAFRCQGRSGAARKSAATPLPTHQTNSTGRRSSSPTKVRSAGSTLVTRGDSVSRRARRVALTLCNEGSYAGGAVQRLLLAPDPWRQLVARVAVRSEHQSASRWARRACPVTPAAVPRPRPDVTCAATHTGRIQSAKTNRRISKIPPPADESPMILNAVLVYRRRRPMSSWGSSSSSADLGAASGALEGAATA